MFKLYSHATVVILAAGILAGCGQVPSLLTGSPKALGAQEVFGHKAPKLDGPMGLLSVADLSEAQKAQLKAIAEKYKPQKPQAAGTRLQALLEADPLDAAALKAALEAKTARPAMPGIQSFEALQEARAVLTEAQRAALVDKLKNQPSPAPLKASAHPERPAPTAAEQQEKLDRLAERLQLDESQKAAFAAFQAKLDAGRPAPTPRPDFTAHRDAMVAFIETGDTTALAALAPTVAPPAFPVEEFIALAQSLTPEQRKQLWAQPTGGHSPKMGRHGHR